MVLMMACELTFSTPTERGTFPNCRLWGWVGDLKKSASDPPEKRQKKCLLEPRTKIGLSDKNSGTNGQFLFRLGLFFVRLGPLFCPLSHFFDR